MPAPALADPYFQRPSGWRRITRGVQSASLGPRDARKNEANNQQKGSLKVNIYKIAGLIGLLLALVAAFWHVPYAIPVLAILGIVIGFNVAGEHHVRVMVSALVLNTLPAVFSEIPTVGPVVTAILANIGALVAGIAILIILRNIYDRLRT